MKIDNGFIDHWKTSLVYETLGAEGIIALIRLWGRAQIDRKWNGLALNPRRLKSICKFNGDEDALWRVFTDKDAPWLDQSEDGTWAIHGFEEHQKQVISIWQNGSKGGRPRKDVAPSPAPPTNQPTSSLSHSLSLSPDANHLVPNENPTKPNGSRSASGEGADEGFSKTEEEWVADMTRSFPDIDVEAEMVAYRRWLDKKGGNQNRRGFIGWLKKASPAIKGTKQRFSY